MPTKKCRTCNIEKDSTEYYKDSNRCRSCDREYLRNWEKKNPEKTRKYWQESYTRNSESIQKGCRNWELNHSNRVTTLQHRRRALLKAAFIEDVSLDELYKRDCGICGICGNLCNKLEASIDHIIPLSKGGEHSYKNTQLAHRRCNSQKRDRI